MSRDEAPRSTPDRTPILPEGMPSLEQLALQPNQSRTDIYMLAVERAAVARRLIGEAWSEEADSTITVDRIATARAVLGDVCKACNNTGLTSDRNIWRFVSDTFLMLGDAHTFSYGLSATDDEKRNHFDAMNRCYGVALAAARRGGGPPQAEACRRATLAMMSVSKRWTADGCYETYTTAILPWTWLWDRKHLPQTREIGAKIDRVRDLSAEGAQAALRAIYKS